MSSSSSSRVPQEDPNFYYTLAEFEVDNVRFRLPTGPLKKSPVFSEMLSKPGEPDNVYHLEDVAISDFREFLQCLLQTGGNPPTLSSWIVAIKLATLWGFEDLRSEAISKAKQDDNPAVRLAVARKYDVKELLPRALEELVSREQPLEVADFELLGTELAVGVMKYREIRRRAVELDPRETVKDLNHRYMLNIFGEKFVQDFNEGESMLTQPPSPTRSTRGKRRSPGR